MYALKNLQVSSNNETIRMWHQLLYYLLSNKFIELLQNLSNNKKSSNFLPHVNDIYSPLREY